MWGVIINPKSGKRALRKQRKYLFKTLKNRGINFDYTETKYAAHASEIARKYVESGVEQLLILGGDGTLSEVINGVCSANIEDSSRIVFALIPRGTGNDWGRYWGLTRDYQKAIEVLLSGKAQCIDLGVLHYKRNNEPYRHYFINSVGFGIDQKVVKLAHILKYYLGSHVLLYLIALVAAIFQHKPQKIRITSNRGFQHRGKLFTMNIGNGCYSGGGMRQNPEANPTDGMFHAMYVQQPRLMDIVKALPSIFNGRLMEQPVIHPIVAEEITLQTEQYLPFEADGILVDACGPYSVAVIPNAIQMIVPR